MYEEVKIGLKSTPTLYPTGATYQIWLSPVVLEKLINYFKIIYEKSLCSTSSFT